LLPVDPFRQAFRLAIAEPSQRYLPFMNGMAERLKYHLCSEDGWRSVRVLMEREVAHKVAWARATRIKLARIKAVKNNIVVNSGAQRKGGHP
jgi:hypothetical protein